jgi:hypothetical protein
MKTPRHYISLFFGLAVAFLSLIARGTTAGESPAPVKIKSITLGLRQGVCLKDFMKYTSNQDNSYA